jgi:hypothetical protein
VEEIREVIEDAMMEMYCCTLPCCHRHSSLLSSPLLSLSVTLDVLICKCYSIYYACPLACSALAIHNLPLLPYYYLLFFPSQALALLSSALTPFLLLLDSPLLLSLNPTSSLFLPSPLSS